MSHSKKSAGQFYTVQSDYILSGVPRPPKNVKVIEPFAGQGDLLSWIGTDNPIEAYDIDPKHLDVKQRDTLLDPPDYDGCWVITNPPYLARNHADDKTVFNTYESNDLYKCFMISLANSECLGGSVIIPVGFFLSPRDIDVACRNVFLSKYRVIQVKYFEEDVFPDTSTTVVVISFEKSTEVLTEQKVGWIHRPSGLQKEFLIRKGDGWIIGGDIYTLSTPVGISVRRHVEGRQLEEGETLTGLTLTALDSGKAGGRIQLRYDPLYVYPAKDSSRAYLTVCIKGITLSPDRQKEIADRFNEFIELKRNETWSLFLPQFRESKEYARKRIPFELAYRIILHLIHSS
jgi:hypothetical protein